VTVFCVSRVGDLAAKVVPHFLAFPLLAKKAADFRTWEEGIRLLHEVKSRKGHGWVGHGRGGQPKWTREESARFETLRLALKAGRIYNACPAPLPLRLPRPQPPTLFDGLP
jgi:hypothetical protein